jgi:HD-like signal output (HDOD) protein
LKGLEKNMPRDAFEKIKSTCDLPSPTGVAMEIVKLADDENATLIDVSQVVETDPATASRILKYVNSPLAGTSNEVASVQHAIALLGIVRVRDIALAFSLVNASAKGPCRSFDYSQFWQQSSARSAAAKYLARRLQCCQCDEAFTCGLLAQVGRLALATGLPQAYSTALTSVDDGDIDALLNTEFEMFGINHRDFGAELLTDWGLPKRICDAVRSQGKSLPKYNTTDTTERLPWLLELSDLFAELLTATAVPRSVLVTTFNRAASAGVKPDVIESVHESIGKEWHAIASIMEVKTRPLQAFSELYVTAI